MIFKRFQQQNPHPQIELNYSSSFELLISVILSAQSTDVGVNKATVNLFKIANTPADILKLGIDNLKNYIKTIGLYNNKAKFIIETCKILISDYDGKVPDTIQELQHLPGVGRKTANVILNSAFQQPTLGVDTHIFRVANRTKLAIGKTPIAVEKILIKKIAKKFLLYAHHWLVLHGRYICTARKPLCDRCIIKDLCEYEKKC